VDVNGTNVEFMIDTGATSIALTPEDARRVGLNLAAAEQTYVGQGAGGALTGQFVRLDRVRLGSRTASDMEAAVIDGASTNLLGQSFLAQFQEVSVRGDVMTLR
jgi:aspartyl protease family protein